VFAKREKREAFELSDEEFVEVKRLRRFKRVYTIKR
jgi:hypothetical protein